MNRSFLSLAGLCSPPPSHFLPRARRGGWLLALVVLAAVAGPAVAANHLRGFGPPQNALVHPIAAGARAFAADVTGDGLDDVVLFNHTGDDVHLCVNVTPVGGQDVVFLPPTLWLSNFCSPTEVPLVGDWDGGGEWDVGVVRRHTGDGYRRLDISYTTYPTAGPVLEYETQLAADLLSTWLPGTGDINGDGATDVLMFSRGASPTVNVLASNGFGVHRTSVWGAFDFCRPGEIPRVADVDGDGKDDILTFNPSNGSVRWMRSAWPERQFFVTSANEPELVLDAENGDLAMSFFAPNLRVEAADFNADGRDDILEFDTGSGLVKVAVSTGAAFSGEVFGGVQWHADFARDGDAPLIGRFDHDANADIAMLWQLLPAPQPRTGIRVAVAGGHARPEAPPFVLGVGTLGRNVAGARVAALGDRPLLIMRLDYPGFAGAPPSAEDMRRRIFGRGSNAPEQTVAGAFSAMSYGSFTYTPAASALITTPDLQDGVITITPPSTVTPGDWTWLLAELENRPGFSFAPFDKDLNGLIETHELTIVEIGEGTSGQVIFLAPFSPQGHPGLRFQGALVRVGGEEVGLDGRLHVMCHELAHTLGAPDLYYPDGAVMRAHSLMGGGYRDKITHLDPFYRMRAGWFTPRSFDLASPYCAAPAVSLTRDFTLLGEDPPAAHSPLHFYDSRRAGPRPEHWMYEYRNSSVYYDSGVASDYSQSFRTGGVFWHLQTDKFTGDELVEDLLAPGANGVMDALPGLAGDDFVQSLAGHPAQTFISGGINLSLDTPFSQPLDVLFNIRTVFPTNRPWLWPDRGGYNPDGIGWKFWSPGPTPVNLYWRNGTEVDRAFQIAESAVTRQHFLQWGSGFQPWLSQVLKPQSREAFCPGELVRLSGHFGVSPLTLWLRTRAGGFTALQNAHTPGYHDPGRMPFYLPNAVPSGKLAVFLGSADHSGPISNAVVVPVFNPVHDWILAGSISNPWAADRLDPTADADGDGVANAVEYVLNTNPGSTTEGPGAISLEIGPEKVTVKWLQFSEHEQHYELVPQISTDLETWSDHPGTSATSPLLPWRNWRSTCAGVPGRLFVRLKAVRLKPASGF